jgi:hypothetical protein
MKWGSGGGGAGSGGRGGDGDYADYYSGGGRGGSNRRYGGGGGFWGGYSGKDGTELKGGDGGDNLRVFETDVGKIGGLICGEHYQPTLKQNLIIQGAQVNCSLWPGYLGGAEELPWVTPAMTTAVASTGACWCILAAEYIPPEKRPKDFYPNTSFYQSFGGSAIISPFGEIVSGPVRDQEGIVYADIDLKVNEMARAIINITGLYSRWDILSLLVRENEYEPIVPMESLEAAALAQATDLGATRRVAEAGSAEIKELREKIAELERRLRDVEANNE